MIKFLVHSAFVSFVIVCNIKVSCYFCKTAAVGFVVFMQSKYVNVTYCHYTVVVTSQ